MQTRDFFDGVCKVFGVVCKSRWRLGVGGVEEEVSFIWVGVFLLKRAERERG